MDELSEKLAQIQQLCAVEAETAVSEMRAMVASGVVASAPLNIVKNADGITSSISPAQMATRSRVYGTHSAGGRGYVFALADLPQTYATVQSREVLVFDYLAEVVSFFAAQGTTNNAANSGMLERYQQRAQTVR